MKSLEYPPERKLEAMTLALRLGNVKAGEMTGVDRSTIYRWLKSDNPADIELVNKAKVERDGQFLQRVHELKEIVIEEMVKPEKIQKAPLRDLAVTFGILTDKEQTLKGHSTINQGVNIQVINIGSAQITLPVKDETIDITPKK